MAVGSTILYCYALYDYRLALQHCTVRANRREMEKEKENEKKEMGEGRMVLRVEQRGVESNRVKV